MPHASQHALPFHEDVFARNLAALGRANGMLFPDRPPEPRDVQFDAAFPSAVHLGDQHGSWVRLHSLRDPLSEANQWIDRARNSRPIGPLVVVLGVGLGYVLEALEARAPATSVLALEAEPALLVPLLTRKDWTRNLDSGQLTLLVGPQYAGSHDAWRRIQLGNEDPLVVIHPVLARLRSEGIRRATEVAKRVLFETRANANARRRFQGTYVKNTLSNLPAIVREADVRSLSAALADVPAIIVGAGPSLDDRLDDLREAADAAVIIATDTAVRPLLAAGIHPDIAVAVDPGDINARHLTALPSCPEVMLVAEGSVAPQVFDEFKGRTFAFQVSDHVPWPWLAGAGISRGRLRAWGSVVTSAFDLSLLAGCDPVMFVGVDLAFTDCQPYCRGTAYEDDWAAEMAHGKPLQQIWEDVLAHMRLVDAVDVRGRPVLSTPTLLAFRDWLLSEMAAENRGFVNATGAGTLHGEAIVQIDLKKAVSDLPRGVRSRVREKLVNAYRHSARTNLSANAGFAWIHRLADAVWPAALDRVGEPESGIGVDQVVSGWDRAVGTPTAARPTVASPFEDAAAQLKESLATPPAKDWLPTVRSGAPAWSDFLLPAPTVLPVVPQLPSDTDLRLIAWVLEEATAHHPAATWPINGSLARVMEAFASHRQFPVGRIELIPGCERPSEGHDLVVTTLEADTDALADRVESLNPWLAPDATLVVVDLRRAAPARSLYPEVATLSDQTPGFFVEPARTSDWWSRVRVLKRGKHVSPTSSLPLTAEAAGQIAARVVATCRPQSVLVFSAETAIWKATLARAGVQDVVEVAALRSSTDEISRVLTENGQRRFDLCLCVGVLEATDRNRSHELIALAGQHCDAIALTTIPPGTWSLSPQNAHSAAYWTLLLLSHGFVLGDDFRSSLQDDTEPLSIQVLHLRLARRAWPSTAHEDPIAFGPLRRELAHLNQRVEELAHENLLLRTERGCGIYQSDATPIERPLRLVPLVLDPRRMLHRNGHCYEVAFRSLAGSLYGRSLLYAEGRLEEDGLALGHSRALIPDIEALGQGRHNFWTNRIFFSTSDNSDPTTNGRRYTMFVPPHVAFIESLPDACIEEHGL